MMHKAINSITKCFFLRLIIHALLAVMCVSCAKNKGRITYSEPLLKDRISYYIPKIKSQYSKREILTVSLSGKQDTVIMMIANTYPDSTETDIIAYDRIEGYDVFFIGEQRDDFYKTGESSPLYAKKKLRSILFKTYGNRPIPGINYRAMTFKIAGHRLVDN